MAIGVYGYYQELGVAGAAAFVFWGIAAVTLHELAHGWAAIWQGDDTPRTYRRMTWNPLVHMGWLSIIMLLVVGIFWGMMPTDPSKYRWGRRGRIIVSGAGPAMNLALAILCWTAYGVAVGLGGRVAGEDATAVNRLAQFALIGGALNGMLALFNMLPIPPFDGASVLAGFSRRYYIWMHNPNVQQWGFFIVLVAMFSGVLGIIERVTTTGGVYLAAFVAGIVRSAAAGA
ncbi:MAG: site-2 protease family protein [Planctomycetaceae bacterium]|nr:site-2 protease family protein [Planctomycetaceae bacterium]